MAILLCGRRAEEDMEKRCKRCGALLNDADVIGCPSCAAAIDRFLERVDVEDDQLDAELKKYDAERDEQGLVKAPR